MTSDQTPAFVRSWRSSLASRCARSTEWLTLSFLALALLFSGCAKRTEPTASTAQTLRISQRNEPADLDPATATLPDEFFIIRALNEGLLNPAPDGSTPHPGVAERWETSRDGLTYTFYLRADARWSNGVSVTAPHFVHSYQRLLTPATAAAKPDLFFTVKNARRFYRGELTDFSAVGFSTPSPRTLVVSLERPTPRFLYYVASDPWIPVFPPAVEQHGRAWTTPQNHVGNGAFRLSEWRPQQHIVLRKNPFYHGANRVRLQEIAFIRFDNEETEERAYRGAQIDVTMTVPRTKLEVYARERPNELHRSALAETRYLAFNTQRTPLNDARVRRALVLAIDRPTLVSRVVRGGQRPTSFYVPPGVPFDDPPTQTHLSELSFDPTAARQALADAGFPGGKDFPELELTGWAQTPVLEVIQQMWQQNLGIKTRIVIREAKVHLSALREGNYDIGFIAEIPDVADAGAVLGNLITRAPKNFSQWSDPEYDRMMSELEREPDAVRRTRIQLRAAQNLVFAAPVAPLYVNAHNWLMSPRVRGWREDAFWTRFYNDVYLHEE